MLPVTWIAASGIPSRSRFCRDHSVGAKCSVAMRDTMARFISSGKGRRLPVRRPASTWPTGIFS